MGEDDGYESGYRCGYADAEYETGLGANEWKEEYDNAVELLRRQRGQIVSLQKDIVFLLDQITKYATKYNDPIPKLHP